jgi:hypothetical protein
MCLVVFVGSEARLPEIQWDKAKPGFYIKNGSDDDYKTAGPILKLPFVYTAGSFMGCACGLMGDEGYESDYSSRLRDIRSFAQYLQDNSHTHTLKIFTTFFEEFPDEYPSMDFDPRCMLGKEFFFEEDAVLIVKK